MAVESLATVPKVLVARLHHALPWKPLGTRMRRIMLRPRYEWAVIEDEKADPSGFILPYLCILVVAGPVAGLASNILSHLFGAGEGVSLGMGLLFAFAGVVLNLLTLFLVVQFLVGTVEAMGLELSRVQAETLAVYALTAHWLGGVVAYLPYAEVVGVVLSLYSLLILYCGLDQFLNLAEPMRQKVCLQITAACFGVYMLVILIAALTVRLLA